MTISETSPPRTSVATTKASEPEVVAGISSGEGQPATYFYDTAADSWLGSKQALVGAAAIVGLVLGWTCRGR